MAKAQEAQRRVHKGYGKRMSDHVASALVVFTLMLIFVTSPSMHFGDMSIMPYFMLVVFVACAIPFCKHLEKKWVAIEAADPDSDSHNSGFTADRAKLWVATLLVPVLLSFAFKAISGD